DELEHRSAVKQGRQIVRVAEQNLPGLSWRAGYRHTQRPGSRPARDLFPFLIAGRPLRVVDNDHLNRSPRGIPTATSTAGRSHPTTTGACTSDDTSNCTGRET